jgi:hypothetical protein
VSGYIYFVWRPTPIRCDRDPKKTLNAIAVKMGDLCFGVHAFEFACMDCFTKWNMHDMHDFSGAHHPDTVSCSACYSKRVLITSVRVSMWEPGAQEGQQK